MTDETLHLHFNGTDHVYSVERRDLTDTDPDYLEGEWICLVDFSLGRKEVIHYTLSAQDALLGADTAQVFADAAQAKADAKRWLAEVLCQEEGTTPEEIKGFTERGFCAGQIGWFCPDCRNSSAIGHQYDCDA